MAIEETFNNQLSILISQLKNAPTKLSRKLSSEAWLFYENVYEIITDCEDDELEEDIIMYTYAMVEALEAVERNWRI